MYDQFGFETPGAAGMPPPGDGGGVHFDFGGFDFGGGAGQGGAGPSFRDLFSQFFRGGGAAAEAPTHAEPGSSLEYQIEISFWEAVRGTVKKLTDLAPGHVHRMPRLRHGGPAAILLGLRRYRASDADERQDALQSNLLAMRRIGAHSQHLPRVRRRRARAPRRYDRGANSGGRANRLARSSGWTRQRRDLGRAAGRPLHHHRGSAAPVF